MKYYKAQKLYNHNEYNYYAIEPGANYGKTIDHRGKLMFVEFHNNDKPILDGALIEITEAEFFLELL
jgi:hypothetical protein